MTALAAALPVFQAVSTGLTVLNGVKSLFGGSRAGAAQQAAPAVSPVTVMPTQDSELVANAKKKALEAQAAKGGRASTVLTSEDSTKFGGN